MKKIDVIIVDDVEEIITRNKMIVNLFPEFNVVDTCYNGEDALETILTKKPALVIIDNQMPYKFGIEVIEEINEMDIENKPAFIMVTGDASPEFNKKAYEKGVFKVIGKNEIDSMLRDVLEEYINYLEII